MPTATPRARPPTPEQAPGLPVPTHDRVGRHEGQVLTPAGTPSASPDPHELVPSAQPGMRSDPSRSGEDGELMAQQQVLEDEVLARTRPSQDGREQHPQ